MALHEAIRQGKSFSGRERNCSFLNLRNGRFADISPVSGLDFPDDGRAVARVDWDHDGDLDFWIVNRSGPQIRFMRNDVPQKNNYIAVRLKGTTCNRDAIGARVELYLKGLTVPLIRTLSAGDGFLSQSSKSLHFGLGDASEIERLVVRWPGGKKEEFSEIKINGQYSVTEQTDQAIRMEPRAPMALESSRLEGRSSNDSVKAISMSRLPLPSLEYKTFSGQVRTVSPSNNGGAQQGILLTLWASWCPDCQAELREWTQRANELRAAGIRVVALSVDGLDTDQKGSLAESQKFIDQIKFPFESGVATLRTVEKLQMIHDHLFGMHRPLPVPSSFLIDPNGKLAGTYKGKIDLDQLLGHVNRLRSGSSVKFPVFPGRWLNKPKAHIPFQLVWKMTERGFLDESVQYIEQNEALLARHFEYHKLLVLVGNGHLGRRDAVQATSFYRKALEVSPNNVEAQNNLAWVLATHSSSRIRNGKEAVRLAESGVKKMGQHPSYMDTLAAAYAEVGRFPEAVATAQRAVQIASSQGYRQMARDIHSRLQYYQAAKPWREK